MGTVGTVPLFGWDKEQIAENPLAPISVGERWSAPRPWAQLHLKANTDVRIEPILPSWSAIHDIAVTVDAKRQPSNKQTKNQESSVTIEFIKWDDKKHNNCRCFIKPIKHTITLTGDEESDRKKLMECRTLWARTKHPLAHRTHGLLTIRASQNCSIRFNPLV